MKTLSLNEPGCECIPSEYLAAMLRRLSEKEGKPVTIEVSSAVDPHWLRAGGEWILIIASLFFGINFLIYLVKGLVK